MIDRVSELQLAEQIPLYRILKGDDVDHMYAYMIVMYASVSEPFGISQLTKQ